MEKLKSASSNAFGSFGNAIRANAEKPRRRGLAGKSDLSRGTPPRKSGEILKKGSATEVKQPGKKNRVDRRDLERKLRGDSSESKTIRKRGRVQRQGGGDWLGETRHRPTRGEKFSPMKKEAKYRG